MIQRESENTLSFFTRRDTIQIDFFGFCGIIRLHKWKEGEDGEKFRSIKTDFWGIKTQ